MNWKNSDDVFDDSWEGCSTEVERATTDDVDRTGGPEATKSITRARGSSGALSKPLDDARSVAGWRAGTSPASRRATRSAINLA